MAVVNTSSLTQISYELSNKNEYMFTCQFYIIHPSYVNGQVALELNLDVVQV
jgi:azurin